MLEIHDPFARTLVSSLAIAVNAALLAISFCILAAALQQDGDVALAWTVPVVEMIYPYMTKISSQVIGIVGSASGVLLCTAFYDKKDINGLSRNFLNSSGKIMVTIMILTIIFLYISYIILPETSVSNSLGSEISADLVDPISILASFLSTSVLSLAGLGPRK